MPRLPPILPGQRHGRWLVIEKLPDRVWWRCRCPCGGEAEIPLATLRARSRKCPSCLGSGKATSLTVEPNEHSPLETPADLCNDLVLASVEDQPEAWPPFGIYRDRDFRAVVSPPQMGFVMGHSALVFPVRLRENGIDTSSLKRCAPIPIGRRGPKVLNLAVRPVPVPLPPDVRASWLREWPGAGNDVEDARKPETPRGHRYADVPSRVAAFLRGRGGTALPDEIVAALRIPRGAVLNARRVDFITSRRIEGGGNTQRFYLLEDGFPEPPDIAPRESVSPMKPRSPKLPPERLVELLRERGGTVLRADAAEALSVSAVVVRDAANACDRITQERVGKFIELTLHGEEDSPKSTSVG